MWWFIISTGLFLFALGMWCLARIRSDYRHHETRKPITVAVVWILYCCYFILTFLAAWFRFVPLDIDLNLARTAGILLMAAGVALFVAGIVSFRTFERLCGVDTSRLVTVGIYRWSRNPQNVGSAIFLLGLALLARSGVALLMAICFWLGFRLYLPVEEKFLARRFGERYEAYRSRVHRFFGPPRDLPQ